jgi:hypothetical protein
MPQIAISQQGDVSGSAACFQPGRLSGNGKNLMNDASYGGDGFASSVSIVTCQVRIPKVRQLQRDDSLNAPRAYGGHNSPTSRQYSLRAWPGSNTYLKDDLLVDCGC